MPQEQKLRLEEKIEIIREYLKGTISKSEAARKSCVASDTIEQWVRNYEADGIDAFLSVKNRVYSLELKHLAVKDYLSGGGQTSDLHNQGHRRIQPPAQESDRTPSRKISV